MLSESGSVSFSQVSVKQIMALSLKAESHLHKAASICSSILFRIDLTFPMVVLGRYTLCPLCFKLPPYAPTPPPLRPRSFVLHRNGKIFRRNWRLVQVVVIVNEMSLQHFMICCKRSSTFIITHWHRITGYNDTRR